MQAPRTETIDVAARQRRPRYRAWLVLLVALAELAHLAWEHSHGGIVSHHVLNRADLPAIWNGWGLVLLPALAWFLGGRAERRISARADTRRAAMGAAAGAFVAMALGAVLSVAFVQGHGDLAAAVFLSIFALALLVPAYRAECVLGFVVAMTFTFGAVLPTLIGCVVAAVSVVAHRVLYPRLAQAWRRMRTPSPEPTSR